MILGIGIDLVQLRDMITGGVEHYKKLILNEQEEKLLDNIPSQEAQAMFIAGRYAAKEALFKALGKYNTDINYHDVSVLNKKGGYTYIESTLIAENVNVHLTMTHTSESALAFVVVESNK